MPTKSAPTLIEDILVMEIEDLKAELASLRGSMHTIVTDFFSHQNSGGALTDAIGQILGDGSRIRSGSMLRFSMGARTRCGEEIQSLELCMQVTQLAVLSITTHFYPFT